MLEQSLSGSLKGFLVGLLDRLSEAKGLHRLEKSHLGVCLLSPAVIEGLVDSKLKLLSDDQTSLQRLLIGMEGDAYPAAVGNTITLPLDIEDNGVAMVLVHGQAGRDELHMLTVLLPESVEIES